MRDKSATDVHWNERAQTVEDARKVNISDTVQRDLELKFIFKHLNAGARVLEVGCGNGYVTQQLRQRVAFVDAFDFAENMIARAKDLYGETNNLFFRDSVLAPQGARGPYDAVLCVRVLINLRDLAEQQRALRNISEMLKPGGRLILVEGFCDGFDAINEFRKQIGFPAVKSAAINFYSSLAEFMPTVHELYVVEDTFHTGLFDFLTRLVYPALIGAENVVGPSEFHGKIESIVQHHEGPDLAQFARLHGFLLIRR